MTIYREVASPTRIIAVIEWDDAGKAKAYVHDAQMKSRMMAAGVVGVPQLSFVRRA